MDGLPSPSNVNGKIPIYFNGINSPKYSMRYHAELWFSYCTYNKLYMKNKLWKYILNMKIKI